MNSNRTPLAGALAAVLLAQCGSGETASQATAGSGQGGTGTSGSQGSGTSGAAGGANAGAGSQTGSGGPDASATADSSSDSGYQTSTSASDATGPIDVGDSGISPHSSLPIPPGAANAPVPTGSADSITVLPWAGFTAAVSFTFDDAQPSQIDNYAALNAVGIPMTFYITTANSWETNFNATWIQAKADGHELGNHTVHHCHADFTTCIVAATPQPTLADELDQCTSYMQSNFGQSDVWTGASPYGDPGYEPYAKTRFLVYRGITDGLIGSNGSSDPFDLPTHVAQSTDSQTTLTGYIDSAVGAKSWWILLVHSIITPNLTPWFEPLPLDEVTGTMGYAKNLASVWTGTVASIGAYWRAEQLLSSITPTGSGPRTWTWTLPAHFPPGQFLRVRTSGGTPSQGGTRLTWDPHGYYEVALDLGSLTLMP